MKPNHILQLVTCCGLVLGLAADAVQARTISASAGMQNTANPTGSVCFRFNSSPGNVGIQKANGPAGGCGPALFTIPIAWDNDTPPGVLRTVRVVGKRGSLSGALTCLVTNYTSSGTIASQSAPQSILSVTAYSNIDLVLNNVPAHSFGVVACSMSVNDAIIQGVDYAQ
jgi:hypothetical protein